MKSNYELEAEIHRIRAFILAHQTKAPSEFALYDQLVSDHLKTAERLGPDATSLPTRQG